MMKVGVYKGVAYKQQKISDIFPCFEGEIWSSRLAYFVYKNEEPTGDYYVSMASLRYAVNNGAYTEAA